MFQSCDVLDDVGVVLILNLLLFLLFRYVVIKRAVWGVLLRLWFLE